MINRNNNKNKVRTGERFSAFLVTCFALFIGLVLLNSGVAATIRVHAVTTQTLPTCVDPTGQNLPCMMVISTLTPPPNAVQCQETSGQILPCSYTTQNLSNGEQIVAITVYVQANYVFTGYGSWTVVKQVIHETKTRIVHESQKRTCERPDANAKTDLDKNLTTVDCDINDANEHGKIPRCERPDANAKTDPDIDLKTIDCDLGDANEHLKTPPPPLCNSANYNGTCPTTNNMTIAASGGKGKGPSCVDNCTTGSPPPVECTKTPNDPSCTQTLTRSTTTPPSTSGTPPSPTTKTCPDGSVIDANANCPTQSTPPTNPNTPSTPPPSTSGTPPPSNNAPPSGSNNGGGGSSSGSVGSGSGSGEGSGPSQPQ